LELEASNFRSLPPRLSFEQSVLLCEETLEWEKKRKDIIRPEQTRCDVEFVM